MRMEGHIVGFDEYMNIVLDDAEEVYMKTSTRKQVGMFYTLLISITISNVLSQFLGRVLLKGDNITLIQNATVQP